MLLPGGSSAGVTGDSHAREVERGQSGARPNASQISAPHPAAVQYQSADLRGISISDVSRFGGRVAGCDEIAAGGAPVWQCRGGDRVLGMGAGATTAVDRTVAMRTWHGVRGAWGARRARMHALLLGALLTLLLAALAQPASAHSDLVSSSPPDGSTLPTSPDELRLRFSAEIDPLNNLLELVTADGAAVALTNAGADLDDPDRVTLVGVPAAPLAAGDYVVRWMVIDANEPERHELTGEITFTIDPNAPPPPSPTPTSVVPIPTSSAQPAPTATTSDDNSGGTLQVAGAAILAIAVIAGGGLLLLRRRQG